MVICFLVCFLFILKCWFVVLRAQCIKFTSSTWENAFCNIIITFMALYVLWSLFKQITLSYEWNLSTLLQWTVWGWLSSKNFHYSVDILYIFYRVGKLFILKNTVIDFEKDNYILWLQSRLHIVNEHLHSCNDCILFMNIYNFR